MNNLRQNTNNSQMDLNQTDDFWDETNEDNEVNTRDQAKLNKDSCIDKYQNKE